ncbi:MAG: hypothetical protein QM817_30035 [Archangium sp.]
MPIRSARPATSSPLINRATTLPRGSGREGVEPMLNPREVKRLERALSSAPVDVKKRIDSLAASFKGEAAPVASALFLRAVTARADRLGEPATMKTLEAFAARAGKLSTAELLNRSSVLDLDSSKNDGAFDPIRLWDKRGNTKSPDAPDAASDNDGLYQRFTASCGPTVLQMVLAEADPVMAFAIHDAGLRSDSTTDAVAKFQRAVLEELGGVAIGRRESHTASRLNNILGRLVTSGKVSAPQREALSAYAKGVAPMTVAASRALETVRAQYDGFPDDAELERVRTALLPARDEGVDTERFQTLMNKMTRELTGIEYRMTNGPDGFARGGAGKYLDAVEKALAGGIDVPFGVSEPAHWMLLTNVKREGGVRSFLVSDPDGGRTAWVKEKDFVSGKFGSEPFQLNKPGERPYVDSFFLPK